MLCGVGLRQLSVGGIDRGFMDNLTIGLVITFVGMGGTLLSLWLITLVIHLLKRLFPYREAEDVSKKETA